MRVWVDADACPQLVKEQLFKASRKRQFPITLVANQPMRIPASARIDLQLVPAGADQADHYIAEHYASGDLVITSDIPLASAIVAQNGTALSPRGEFFTEANIGERLAMRNLMDQLRSGGMVTGGPAEFSGKDQSAFANQLDRWLTKAGF